MARLFDDASSQYLERAAAVVSAVPLTISAWFNSNDSAATQGIVCLGNPASGDANAMVALYASGGDVGDPVKLLVGTGGTWTAVVTTSGYSVNTWHHACAVCASSTSRSVYIDGGSVGTDTTSKALPPITTTGIGELIDPTREQFFSGNIAEVGIWDVALDAAEIAALGKGFSPVLIRPQSLVAYWPIGGNDSPELDRWKNRYDLTLANTPTKSDHPRIYYTTGWVA